MTARIVPLRPAWKREQLRRRRLVEAALREAEHHIRAGLRGEIPLADAVHGANRALIPAIRETCKADIA